MTKIRNELDAIRLQYRIVQAVDGSPLDQVIEALKGLGLQGEGCWIALRYVHQLMEEGVLYQDTNGVIHRVRFGG